jgi:hypothetical protein
MAGYEVRRLRATAHLRSRLDPGLNRTAVARPGDGARRIGWVEMEFDDAEASFWIMSGSERSVGVRRQPAARSTARREAQTLSPYRQGPAKLARLAAEIPPPADTLAA